MDSVVSIRFRGDVDFFENVISSRFVDDTFVFVIETCSFGSLQFVIEKSKVASMMMLTNGVVCLVGFKDEKFFLKSSQPEDLAKEMEKIISATDISTRQSDLKLENVADGGEKKKWESVRSPREGNLSPRKGLLDSPRKRGDSLVAAKKKPPATIDGSGIKPLEGSNAYLRRNLSGWLYKLSGNGKGKWERRFFVLIVSNDPCTLTYYQDEAMREKGLGLGFLDLSQMEMSQTLGKQQNGEQTLWTFMIKISMGRTWQLGTEDPVDNIIWLNQLTSIPRSVSSMSPRKGSFGQNSVPKSKSPSRFPENYSRTIKLLAEAASCYEADSGEGKPVLYNPKRERLASKLLLMLEDEDDGEEETSTREQNRTEKRETSHAVMEELATLEEDIFCSEELEEDLLEFCAGLLKVILNCTSSAFAWFDIYFFSHFRRVWKMQ